MRRVLRTWLTLKILMVEDCEPFANLSDRRLINRRLIRGGIPRKGSVTRGPSSPAWNETVGSHSATCLRHSCRRSRVFRTLQKSTTFVELTPCPVEINDSVTLDFSQGMCGRLMKRLVIACRQCGSWWSMTTNRSGGSSVQRWNRG